MNQPKPSTTLTDFLQADAKLVDEILARLCALQLSMVRQWRSAAAQELIRDMPPSAGSRESINKPDNSDGIIEKSLLKIVANLARRCSGTFSELNVGR